MRRNMIRLTSIFMLMMATLAGAQPLTNRAQTQNQTSKSTITETFTFPNECTHELMEVTSTSTITCHDQTRPDGTFQEKCEIRQDVTAVGQVTGITFHGTATFKDEFAASDSCNFSFTNRGRVHLISPGSAVNTILTFDDIVRKENCVLTTDQHLVAFDCRGSRP